jgi:hypothetical protein
MRGALVLFEGLPPTVIDSQVLTHVRLAREQLDIDLVAVAVACSPALFETSQSRLGQAREAAGGEVQLIRGVRPALPGSMLINRLLLGRKLDRLGAFSFLHARADYAAAVVGPWARRRGLPMLWDCRGDSRAELQERLGIRAPAMLRYRSRLLERELQFASQTCAGACFVTRQLRELMAPYMAGQPSWVIPCLAPETDFFFDPLLRERVRNEFAIGPDEAVYVYSGSLIAYQRFDETIATFRAALAAGQKARLIVLTPEAERAQKICADLPAKSVICKSVRHTDVNGYLNAADFGMLLRDSTPVNVVAFPTKFAEYAMTGLRVIMKEAPPSCIAVARELGNYLPLGAQAAPWPAAERARCAAQAAQRLSRSAAMPNYAEIYNRLSHGQTRQPVMAASPTATM